MVFRSLTFSGELLGPTAAFSGVDPIANSQLRNAVTILYMGVR